MMEEFGDYRLHRTINVGSIGEVFLAERLEDTAVGRPREPIVIKRLHRELARLPEHVELFREEGRLAQHFSHPNLVKAFDAGDVGRDHYIAMELVRGPNLLQLRGLERPTVARVVDIVIDIATGLDQVHQAGRLHCDVSPSNILAGPERALLTDFGVATLAGHAQRGTVRGTFGYMSPEQARGEPLDRRSDVFSLGIVLWELLKHEPLFQRRERYLTLAAVVEDGVPPLGDAALAPLEPVVQRALAKDPAERFESCLALAGTLREAMAGMEG
jgi:eukaryotic-like serine/threonine-protein kinase